MASIKDVARHAEVSTTTVSRVLSSPEAVRPVLRQRVEAAIAALAYRPNLAARRLRQQRASLIGLIVSDIRSPFFTDLARAVEDVAYRHGLRLILCNTDEDPAKEQSYLALMADEQASGVIISPTSELLRRYRPEAWPFPLVMVDRAQDDTAADRVLLDNHASGRRLTEHLLAAGYRRIVALAGARSTTGRDRHAGYAEAMRGAGLAPREVWLAPTVEAGRAAVEQLLLSPQQQHQQQAGGGERVDAVLATNGLLLLGAAQAVQAAGVAVPREMGLAGFDNNDWTTLPAVDVTVIEQPTYDIGRTAAELLMQRVEEPLRVGRCVVLGGRLVVRGSTRRGGSF